MIAAIASLFIFLIYFGGGLSITHPVYGLLIGGTASLVLGALFASLQMVKSLNAVQAITETTVDYPDGLNVGQVRDALVSDDTLVFTWNGNASLTPVITTFECLVDGKRVLVVEPMDTTYYETMEQDEEELF